MHRILSVFVVPPLTVLLILWAGGFIYFTQWIKNAPLPPENTENDALVVLTGGPERINTGLDLLIRGKAPKLFISGVNERVTLTRLQELWASPDAQAALKCCVTLGYEARNTRQNATETAQWINTQDNIHSFRLITASYHMPRALMELRASLPDQKIIPHPVQTKAPARSQAEYHLLVLSEYHKTLLTWLRLHLK